MRKPVLDHGNILSVHRAVTGGAARGVARRRLRPGDRYVEVSTWWYRDGRRAGRIGHETEIHADDAGTLTLAYDLDGEPVRQVFDLVGRPCRFGGYRWLARCPRSGRLVAKLYGCRGRFLPRHLLRASYRSQDRVPPAERLRDREVAILRRLGADDHSPPMPPRPKWMRWPTYWRLAHELLQVRSAYGLALCAEFRQTTGEDLMADADPGAMERVRRLAARLTGAD